VLSTGTHLQMQLSCVSIDIRRLCMKSKTVSKVGVWASIVCIIHCTILPFVVPIIPVLGVTTHNEWIEIVFWILSLSTALWKMFHYGGLVRYWFGVVSICGSVGLAVHSHELLHAGFYGIAAGSLWCLLRKKSTQTKANTQH